MTYSFEGNRVVRDTGAEFPIFQAPIGLISRAPLVSAVSAAGGVGLMETMLLKPTELQEQHDLIRARTSRPYGIHLMADFLSKRPDQEAAILDWALSGKTKFVTTGYGDPIRHIRRVKDAGAKIYSMCDTLEEALRLEDAGADGIILGGAEKGGGSQPDNLHLFALLQQARARLGLPIVATGGIVDGHGMAAAFALGAEGVLMGTRFIASRECPWHNNYKQAIVDADQVIGIESGIRNVGIMRAVRTSFAEAVARGEAGHKQNPYAGDPLKLFYEGRTDQALVGCGESAVLIKEVKSAAEIVNDTLGEFWSEIERLSNLREPGS